MAIRGNLREASLPDVLQLLAMGKKTGCLSIAQKQSFGNIYFNKGRIAFASVVNRRDRLGDVLVKHGLLTETGIRTSKMRFGAIVAVVSFEHVLSTVNAQKAHWQESCGQWQPAAHEYDFGNYEEGRYAYLSARVYPLQEAVPCRGQQAVPFTVPTAVERAVWAILGGGWCPEVGITGFDDP